MKLIAIAQGTETGLGVALEGAGGEALVLDVKAALADRPSEGIPSDMMELIAGGEAAKMRLAAYVAEAKERVPLLREADVAFAPCVPRPGKIVCVGLNYRRHAEETNAAIPAYPILFNKFNNALAGHLADVALPVGLTTEVDYEAELAIVIGKRAQDVPEDEALGYAFGYCNANDLSARDLQMRTPQWMLGKTLDGFCPLGPYLVTADEVGDPNALGIRCIVNGERRQNSHTSDMIFSCASIVSYLSRYMTLEPGDVILTGTPEGVVLGYPPERRVYLKPGDVVTIEIDKLGSLTNVMTERRP